MDDEQLYVYGFQVVGYTNADANCHTNTDSDRYSYTNGHTDTNPNANCYSRYRCCGDVEPATGVDLYFVKRDFYLERWKRDRLLSFRRQFATWRRCLQFRPSDRALENGE